MRKYILSFIAFTLFQVVTNAQTLQEGIYSGVSLYQPEHELAVVPQTTSKWDNDLFVRWEPKGNFGYEVAFTSFVENEANELHTDMEPPFRTLELDRGFYNYYQISGRAQYRFFHSKSRRFNCFGGLSSMLYMDHFITYSKYYSPDTAFVSMSRKVYDYTDLLLGINVKANYWINRHLIISALLQYQHYAFSITSHSLYPPISRYPGDIMETYQLGLSYVFKY